MEETIIRKAMHADLAKIRTIYDSAKQYMNLTGNPTQWAIGYPPSEQLELDIEQGTLHVVVDSEGIGGVFALIPGIDPTYLKIDGAWLSDAPYAAIHRVASNGRIRGIVSRAVEYAHATLPGLDLRIDTHENNSVMQKALAREGFVRCGTIYLANGSPRWAYQLEWRK